MNIASVTSSPSAASSSPAPAGKAAEATAQRHKVAGQFEAILVRQMLGDSLTSLMGGEKGPAGNVYGYFLTDMISEKLTTGTGLGLGKVIEQQLSPHARVHATPSSPTTT